MANILPQRAIHKILSYLSFREATKLSLVSKTWLKAWFTHPYLDFTIQPCYSSSSKYGKDIKFVHKILKRYYDRKTHIKRFVFFNFLSLGELYPLIDKWLGVAVQNGVKDFMFRNYELNSRDGTALVPSYPVPVFTILTANSLRELVLMECDLMHLSSSTSHHVETCSSLRKLSLIHVRLDENVLQNLLTKCPLIDSINIEYCDDLGKIDLRNLQKIRSVSIKTFENIKIQAPTIEYLSYSCSGSFEELYIVECPNLKSLELSCGILSDGIFLEHLISRFQFLESLTLDSVCKGSERFNICGSQSLRILKIKFCSGIGEIDAPNLVSLEYMGNEIPEFKKEPNQLKRSKIFLEHFGTDLNDGWFCKLRTFLSNSTTCGSQVSLYFNKCSNIDNEELKPHNTVAIPQVDVLDVRIAFGNSCPTFVDALLWSCHPRRLNLRLSTVETITCFMDRLMHMKNSSDSTQLKEVKAYKLDHKNQPVELKSGELTMWTLMEEVNAYFLLDW